MFKRKKKITLLALYDAAGVEQKRMQLDEYALPEETVIALSVKFYNDPEPCYIHRGAVRQRAMMELAEAHLGAEPVAVSLLSDDLRACFPESSFVRIWEEAQ